MKRQGNFRRLSLCLLLFAAIKAQSAQNRWPLDITASGKPLISVPLATSPDDKLDRGIWLKHELVYDGQAYVSRIIAPEITSHLVERETNRFDWRRFDGSTVKLELNKKTQGQPWHLTRSGTDRYLITSTDETQSYEYSACVPVRARIDACEYRFIYSKDRLDIERVRPTRENLISVVYRDDGTADALLIHGQNYIFDYNDAFQLISVRDQQGEIIAHFSYKGGLLSGAVINGTKHPFEWGTIDFTEYHRPINRLPPVVTSDGTYNYSLKMDDRGINATFHAINGNNPRGWWDLNFRTSEVHLTVQRQ